LEQGDRLTREEFESRYEAMPHLKKAELIDGVVFMPCPLRFERHGEPGRLISWWLGDYQIATPGTLGADNATVRLPGDNEPQPDSLLLIGPARGGQAQLSADDYVEGAPELIVEVAASSASYDLHAKLDVYRRHGVREYIVWRVLDQQIDWFILRNAQYDRLAPGGDGILRSEVFPGLWLDTAALLAGDLSWFQAVARQGTASPEHAAFAARFNAPPATP
jgi:Uma2 family endonuclease